MAAPRRKSGVGGRALRHGKSENRALNAFSAFFGFHPRLPTPDSRRDAHDNPPKLLLTAAFSLCILATSPRSQPLLTAQDPSLLNSLDSLKRVIARRILSDAEKKDIRACDREKSRYLKQCRAGDTATARVDRQLTEAKRTGADPNDPAIQALLERKFALEKACDDAFAALPRGKQCRTGENKRREALEKALQKDKQYQALLKKTEAPGPEPL
ncbi:MAG TPA: hypothetical protein VJ385_05540 [Fibrobacteria bacterium]|nr:hypothetical protein [Fibrobacteria bacterium]